MLVFRDLAEPAALRPLLAELADRIRRAASGASEDQWVDLLVGFGEWEAALADALFPSADSLHPLADAARDVARGIGHGLRLSGGGRRAPLPAPSGAMLERALARLEAAALPGIATRKVAEGFAFYGLYPQTYAAAAERLAAVLKPERAVCIGLRSIGTSLSAVVGAVLEAAGCSVRLLTLRPRGHPFDRRPAIAPALAEVLRGEATSWHVIVDEGPGLSGSSFCGTASALIELGLPEDRIVFVAGRTPDPAAFKSADARRRWPRQRSFVGDFERDWLARGHLPEIRADLSGGLWRKRLGAARGAAPATNPWHERRKFLSRGPRAEPRILKFAGLGQHGRDALARARSLAEAGFGPPVAGLCHGFLVLDLVPGDRLRRSAPGPAMLAHAARYLAFLLRRWRIDAAPEFDRLMELIEVNLDQGLGATWQHRCRRLESFRDSIASGTVIAVDGRMLPEEWIAAPNGLMKCDGVDHHRDHFFPGCQDAAWDAAGLAVEFGLSGAPLSAWAAYLAEVLPDPRLPARLPFYLVAYGAWRLGYAAFSAEQLAGTVDGRRMSALADLYRSRIKADLSALD